MNKIDVFLPNLNATLWDQTSWFIRCEYKEKILTVTPLQVQVHTVWVLSKDQLEKSITVPLREGKVTKSYLLKVSTQNSS